MSTNSKIEWTDHTCNPWRGCTKVHEGCAHCYAEREAKRFPANRGIWGPNGTRVKAADEHWKLPLKWDRWARDGVCLACEGRGWIKPRGAEHRQVCPTCGDTGKVAPYRARVFCASLADVFEDWQGPIHDHHGDLLGFSDGEFCKIVHPQTPYRATMDDLRRQLFALIDATPHLDWLLLTKRPENVRRMWPVCVGAKDDIGGDGQTCSYYRRNVQLLTSVSNQATADRMVPELLKCRDLVPVLGLSIEPLLGPVDLSGFCGPMEGAIHNPLSYLDWVIVGGESGHGARPMHPDWVRSLRDQCQAAGVPFFFKQGSQNNWDDYKDFDSFPADLRIREFPGDA